jgi:tol-pal system protein YbgF
MTMPKFDCRGSGLLVVAFFALSGCTIGVQPHPTATSTPAHSEVKAKPPVIPWKSDISAVKSQLKKSGEIQSRALSGVERRLSLLEKEVNELRGNLDLAQRENQQLRNRLATAQNAQIYVPANKPLALPPPVVEIPSPPVVEAPPVDAPPPVDVVVAAEKPVELAPPASAQDAYESAYQKLLARQFPASAQEFTQFLKWFPEDDLADNAQYWIGELHYVQKQFPDALQAFNTVLVRWPSSPKVPPCLLKIGFAFYELGDMENARASLNRLVTDYPSSNTVALANQRLKLIAERIGDQ